MDGEPSDDHPYPELFAYNKFKQSETERGIASIQKRANFVTGHDRLECNSATETGNDAQPAATLVCI